MKFIEDLNKLNEKENVTPKDIDKFLEIIILKVIEIDERLKKVEEHKIVE